MRSGSAVTRDVADIVLIDDSLAALLPARLQGRRIITGIAMSTQVFLARVATQGLVIVAVTMLGLGFPYSPAQGGLTLFTVGVPTLFLTAWARPAPPDPHLLATLGRFVLPAAVLTAGGGVAVYAALYTRVAAAFTDDHVPGRRRRRVRALHRADLRRDADFTDAAATIGAQTGPVHVRVAGVGPADPLPRRRPRGCSPPGPAPTGDKRPAILVAALLAVLIGALFTPAVSDYFGLTGAAPPGVHDGAARAGGLVRRPGRRLPVPRARPTPRSGAPARTVSGGAQGRGQAAG